MFESILNIYTVMAEVDEPSIIKIDKIQDEACNRDPESFGLEVLNPRYEFENWSIGL